MTRRFRDIRDHRLPLIAACAIFFAAAGDATRQFGIQGVLTVAVACLAAIMFIPACFRGPKRVPGRVLTPAPLLLFLGYAATTLFRGQDETPAIQNLLVYAIFVLSISVAAASARTPQIGFRFLQSLRWAGVISALVYLAAVARYGPNTGMGLQTARAAAGTLMVPLTAAAVLSARHRARRWPIIVIGATVLATLSRAQSVEMLILLTLTFAANSDRPAKVALRFFSVGAVFAGVAFYAYNHYAPLRQRFEVGDGYSIGNFTLNTSGRINLWSATWQSWRESPWFGHGVGASEELIFRRYPPNAHPHNDYLRLLNDFGVLGFLLFAVGFFLLMRAFWRSYRSAAESEARSVHLAAMLVGVFLLMGMTLNNPIVAIFLMLPIAVLFGMSWGLSPPETRLLASRESVAGRANVDLLKVSGADQFAAFGTRAAHQAGRGD